MEFKKNANYDLYYGKRLISYFQTKNDLDIMKV